MKHHWHQSRISSAIAIIAACISISSMIVSVCNEEIKTRGIETVRFKFPKLVSRFDLDDVNPGVASKIEGGASRIVEEVSSKATAVSKALKNVPTEVSLGMDEVCWGASASECTPIWKGIDNWFSGPLEHFIKIKEYSWTLDIVKLNILRLGTTIAIFLFLLALLGWLVSSLSWESVYHSVTRESQNMISREGQLKQVSRERQLKQASIEGEDKEPPTEGEEKEVSTKMNKDTSRFVTIMVALISCVIMLLLLLNLMVVFAIGEVLAGVPDAIQSVPGNLRDLFILSFLFNIVFLVFFCLSRTSWLKMLQRSRQ